MKKNVLLRSVLLLGFAALLASVCSLTAAVHNDKVSVQKTLDQKKEKKIKVSEFSKIATSTGIQVGFVQKESGTPEVTINAPEKFMDHIKVVVNGDVLKIYWDSKKGNVTVTDDDWVYVEVCAPSVRSVEAGGGSRLTFESDIRFDNELKVSASSGASVEFKREVKISQTLFAQASSGSEIRFNKNLTTEESAHFQASSGSRIVTATLSAETLKLDGSSAATIRVNYLKDAKSVSADASSAATLKMKGVCNGSVRMSATSASTIEFQNLTAESAWVTTKTKATVYAPICKKVSMKSSGDSTVNLHGGEDVEKIESGTELGGSGDVPDSDLGGSGTPPVLKF